LSEDATERLSSNKTEYIEVNIKLPKAIVEFVEAFTNFIRIDADTFLRTQIIQGIRADLDTFKDVAWIDIEKLIKRYKLEEIFEKYC